MVVVMMMLIALVVAPQAVVAQEPRTAVGGAINLVTQAHSDFPLGGTTIGGSVLVGVRVAPRVSIEFEPSFGGSYSWEYTYRPAPSLMATVLASRRDLFFPVQARI